MTTQKNNLIVAALLVFSLAPAQKNCLKLRPTASVSLSIPEPSDICYNPIANTFFIVCDNGILFETDRDGKPMRSIKQRGTDFEAVYCDEHRVTAVDETHRTLWQYDVRSLKLIRTVSIPYGGGRNKGYEAFTFNESKKLSLIFTEKEPVWLFELDSEFKVVNQIDLSKIASDISAATYHDNFLWLLSDEDMTLMKVDPIGYELVAKWKLPLLNPEGLAFDKDGKILITCDDMQRLYYFDNPEQH